jgi:hypothetical protein
MDNITVVSGYWPIQSKFNHEQYNIWFKNTLQINQQYIFFCDKYTKEYIRQVRNNLETYFIDYPLNNFYSKKYYKNHWIDPMHIPSVELGIIWLEKMHFMKLAKDSNLRKTEFYVWIDAGVCIFRDNMPPSIRLNLKDINTLPHDKVCYSHVDAIIHNFAGTVIIMHHSIIDKIHDMFYEYVQKYSNIYNDWRCGSDQIIFNRMLDDHPYLFHKFSEGYGENLVKLYSLC